MTSSIVVSTMLAVRMIGRHAMRIFSSNSVSVKSHMLMRVTPIKNVLETTAMFLQLSIKKGIHAPRRKCAQNGRSSEDKKGNVSSIGKRIARARTNARVKRAWEKRTRAIVGNATKRTRWVHREAGERSGVAFQRTMARSSRTPRT